MPRVPFRGKPKTDRYMEPEEYRQLLAATDDPEPFALFLMMGTTGMRTIEVTWVLVEDVDPRNCGFTKRIAKQKSERDHFMKISPELLEVLKLWAQGRKPKEQLVLYRGSPITRRQIRYLFHKYKKKAGIRSCLGPHSMRHHHGIVLTEAGYPAQEVAQRLGHKTLDMVLQYAHLRGARNAEMAAAASAAVGQDLLRRALPPKTRRRRKA